MAVPERMSSAEPSPQLTVMPVTVAELDTVKVTVTIWPVLAGSGVGLFTVTMGIETGA